VGVGEPKHGIRGVGGDHSEPGVDKVGGEQAAPTTDLDDQPITSSHGFKKANDAGSTCISVEPETQMVNECEVVTIVGRLSLRTRFHGDEYYLRRHPSLLKAER
jgi:hypothetical protein